MHDDAAWQIGDDYLRERAGRRYHVVVGTEMPANAGGFRAGLEAWGIGRPVFGLEREARPAEGRQAERIPKIRALRGVPDAVRYAILGRAPFPGWEYQVKMGRAIWAGGESSGLVASDVLAKRGGVCFENAADSAHKNSKRKTTKDKALARSVRREDLVQRAANLGVELGDHIRPVAAAVTCVTGQPGVKR